MRILMLGNSYTFFNDMPDMLAEITGAEVVAITKGGAYLSVQLDTETETGAKAQEALTTQKWDYVVLQEYSSGPIKEKESFMNSVTILAEQARKAGATPVLYATWAYKKGSDKMASMEMSYDDMYEQMYASYHEAGEKIGALVADVGKKFYELTDKQELIIEDGSHPNAAASRIAAEIIAEVIREHK